MGDTELIAGLREKIEYHQRKVRAYQTALAELADEEPRRSATAAANSKVAQSDEASDPRTSNVAMIRLVLEEAVQELSVPELTAKMTEAGWVTESKDRVNTVRTAVRRMVEKGDVVRTESGRYAVPSIQTIARVAPVSGFPDFAFFNVSHPDAS